ncbi:MAG: hypothetical protein IZT55_07090 [Anaerolineae bacterium]|nr:hypothetical protein [Anaerolineae bacterium]
MSRSKMLNAMQIIDSQLDRHQSRLQEIEVALADNEILHKAQISAKNAEEMLTDSKKSLQQSERNVRQQRIRIEQSESSLYSGKVINPKELQDLQSEIKSLKRFLSTLEDRQLDKMLALDIAQEFYQDKDKSLMHATTQSDNINAALISEREHIENEILEAQIKKDHQWAMISERDQKKYLGLRKSRAGVAVSEISNKACSACGTILTEVTFRSARSPNQLVVCDTCDRILFTK